MAFKCQQKVFNSDSILQLGIQFLISIKSLWPLRASKKLFTGLKMGRGLCLGDEISKCDWLSQPR